MTSDWESTHGSTNLTAIFIEGGLKALDTSISTESPLAKFINMLAVAVAVGSNRASDSSWLAYLCNHAVQLGHMHVSVKVFGMANAV
jgi:hypothetical protein